jgi:serine/threonine protein kinase/Tfp pilus assembly protein PilF
MAEIQTPVTVASPAAESLSGIVAGRFLVRERLGAGGMGEVYRAEDTKLRRDVALKRLAPHLRREPQYRERFLQEAKRASQLTDPHIAAIHDVIEDAGEVFLVMEYVKGENLRRSLRGPLPHKRFLDVAVQCAQALVTAHEHGIVHCDIKPENIMLTSAGQVKILDFGIAKHLPQSDQSSTVDRSDSMRGTPAYMAPEVLREHSLDGRADIFSLGVVFYEMLTARHPFRAGSFVGTCERILHETPTPVSNFNPEISPALRKIVGKMLAKQPSQRYLNAADLLQDLLVAEQQPTPARVPFLWRHSRRAIAGWSLLVLVIGGTAFISSYQRPRIQRWLKSMNMPAQKQLAVLPFTCSADDANQHAFCDGMSEIVTVKLGQLAGKYPIQVVPASELRGFTSAEEVRKKYGVNLVLEGSLRQSGNKARVSYSLIDVSTRRQLRSDSITADAGDPFALEDRAVDSILYSLDLELRGADRQALASHGTAEPAAYDYYLQGRGYLQDSHRPENIESAIVVFNNALGRDPNYALAYAGLGEAYWDKYQQTHNSDWVGKASHACEVAINLGKSMANGYACSGVVLNGTGKYELAVQQFQQALSIDPTSDDSYVGLAFSYEQLGKLVDAEATYRRAISLRPQYWGGYNRLGAFYWRTGRYPEATAMFKRVVALAPDNHLGYSNLGALSIDQGHYSDAISWLKRSVAIRPTDAAYSNLATTDFYLRRFGEAAHNYEEAIKLDENNYELWGNLGDARYWASSDHNGAAYAYQKAIGLAEKKLAVNARDPQVQRDLALYHSMLLEKAAAFAYLQRALNLAPKDPETLFKAALVHEQIGDEEQALNWLEKALTAGYAVAVVRDTPMFDRLNGKPRFQRLISGKYSAGNGAK